jgi:hypothetical protein
MSNPETSFNPYAAPAQGYSPTTYAPPPGTRPGWYIAFCVIAIVLGILGALGGALGAMSVVANQSFQRNFGAQPAMPGAADEMMELQNEMQQEILAVERRYMYYLITTQVLVVVVGSGLAIGGFMALQMTKTGASVLGNMFLVASVFDVGRLVLTVIYQIEMGQVMGGYMSEIMQKAGQQGGNQPPPGLGEIMSTAVTVGIWVGVCFSVAWVVIKLLIYIPGWMYLSKPQTQALLK